MMTAQRHQVQTLRLKSDSREHLASAVSLIEDALRIACSSTEQHAGIPLSSGAQIFIRKINLGHVALTSHATLLADKVRAQMRQGALKIVCIDQCDNLSADVVWLSDELTACRRLLFTRDQRAWYWPLIKAQSQFGAPIVDAESILNNIAYRFGDGGVKKFIKLLLRQGQLSTLMALLPEPKALSGGNGTSPMTLPLRSNHSASEPSPNLLTKANVIQTRVKIFIAELTSQEHEHLQMLMSREAISSNKKLWVLRYLTLGNPLVHYTSESEQAYVLQVLITELRILPLYPQEPLCLVSDHDAAAAEASDPLANASTPQFGDSKANDSLRQASQQHDVKKVLEHGNKSTHQEHLHLSVPSKQNDRKAAIKPYQDLPSVQQSHQNTCQRHIECSGAFFMINLLEVLVPPDAKFVTVGLPIKMAILAWLLNKLGCDGAIEKQLAIPDDDIERLFTERVINVELPQRWMHWLASRDKPNRFSHSMKFGDYLFQLVKLIRGFLIAESSNGIKRLCLLPGEVLVSNTHLDLFLDANTIDVQVRKLGLDISPGWLPWLTKVVNFHYRGEKLRTHPVV